MRITIFTFFFSFKYYIPFLFFNKRVTIHPVIFYNERDEPFCLEAKRRPHILKLKIGNKRAKTLCGGGIAPARNIPNMLGNLAILPKKSIFKMSETVARL
jgi:hypothetical protein